MFVQENAWPDPVDPWRAKEPRRAIQSARTSSSKHKNCSPHSQRTSFTEDKYEWTWSSPDSAQTQKKPYNKAETHFLGRMQRHCLFIQEWRKLQLWEVKNKKGFLKGIRSKRKVLLLAGMVNVVRRVMRKGRVSFILWFSLARLDLRSSRCLRPWTWCSIPSWERHSQALPKWLGFHT